MKQKRLRQSESVKSNHNVNKIIILFFPIMFSFYSCDPAYYLLVRNRSGQDEEIQVKAFSKNIEFYELNDNMFKKGKLVRKDTLNLIGKFEKILLPAGQTIKINGVGIAIPRGESIIVKADTIDAATFQAKGGFFTYIKLAYSIDTADDNK